MDDLLALLNGGAAKPASQPAAVAPVVSINPAPRVEPVFTLAEPEQKVDFTKPASMPAVKVAEAVAVVDASIAGARPTDEQIGAVVRFLFGK